MAVSADVRRKIAELYPDLLFLVNDPQVGPLLAKAVGPEPFSEGRFLAELRTTSWFKRQSENQRQWSILKNTDAGQAKYLRGQAWTALANEAAQLGVALSGAQKKYLSEVLLQNEGWRPGQAMPASMGATMRTLFTATSLGSRAPGTIDVAAQQINALSKQYMLPMNSKQFYNRGELVATGASSMEAQEAAMRVQAAKLYPHLKGQIAAGETVRGAIAGQVELYAQELEVDPEVIYGKVWSNGWERQMLGMRDPKSGQTRLPTQSEVIKMARSTPSWWKTSGGRQADASMASNLLNVFGKRAGTS
jgi:hypothetical protein